MHNGHKIIPIEEEETLKKEKFNINDYIKEFNESAKNIVNINKKIENEIKNINESYEKMKIETKKSFELKHEKLLKEENETKKLFELKHEKLIKEEKEIKDRLDNEVTKIKEKLEEYLSLSNTLIRNHEKINKGIQILNKDEQNKNTNMLKKLTYVSKLNKNQKEMSKISQILMKNIKLDFVNDNIKYEEYYFNGLPIPKDIQYDIISHRLSWKLDDINMDKNKIKFKIDIRKENEQFESIYENNNMNYNINNLEPNANYEIRLCTIYNNYHSEFSNIIKFKSSKIDSLLLGETKQSDECLNKIYEWTGGKDMKLLYRGTRDGMSAYTFHNKCNNKGPTISLFKNEKGYIFGGYSSIDWTSCNNYKSAPDSFIFTLTNMYNIPPTKFPNSDINHSIHDFSSYGPCFGGGHDIGIRFNSKHYTNFPYSYKDVTGKGFSIFKGDDNTDNFNLKEIEVFKLIK